MTCSMRDVDGVNTTGSVVVVVRIGRDSSKDSHDELTEGSRRR